MAVTSFLPWFENFLVHSCDIFLHVVYKCSLSSRGAGSSSHGAQLELHKICCCEIFILFIYVGNFGFTRPIQDFSHGPGIPLAYK